MGQMHSQIKACVLISSFISRVIFIFLKCVEHNDMLKQIIWYSLIDQKILSGFLRLMLTFLLKFLLFYCSSHFRRDVSDLWIRPLVWCMYFDLYYMCSQGLEQKSSTICKKICVCLIWTLAPLDKINMIMDFSFQVRNVNIFAGHENTP